MTTPGPVNLPFDAMTIDTLASRLQDMSAAAMKGRAVQRFPSIMDQSTGLSPASDVTPFGLLTRIFAQVLSLVANADPADVQGPEDLPPLVLEFIEGLPLIGQFVGVLEAILGTYDGDDQILKDIQNIFAPIRMLMQLVSGQTDGIPSPEAILTGWENAIVAATRDLINTLLGGQTGSPTASGDLASLSYLLSLPSQATITVTTQLGQIAAGLAAGLAGLTQRVAAVENIIVDGAVVPKFDDFNQPAIGSNWTNVAGTLATYASAYVQTPALAAGYRNDVEATTDKHGQAIRVTNKFAGACRSAICSDTAMSNYAACEVRAGNFGDDYVRVVAGSSPSLVVTMTQLSMVIDPEWVFDIRYDPALNSFFVLRNGITLPELTWKDTANLISHGPTKRKTPIVSNADDKAFALGFAITDVTLYDW